MGAQPRLLSASRAAAILGVSEFSTTREVWQLIREERQPGWNAAHGYTLPPAPDSAAIRWGTAFEDAVVELAEQPNRQWIVDREKEFTRGLGRKKYADIMTCHVDGIYGYPETPIIEDRVLHEGKTTTAMSFRQKWGDPGTDAIPRGYQAQVQHQMLVTGAREVIVSVLVFPEAPETWERNGIVLGHVSHGPTDHYEESCLNRKNGDEWQYLASCRDWARTLAQMGYFHQYPVKANPTVHAAMLSAYREFWDRYILGDEIPPATTPDDVKRLFPEPVGTWVVDEQTERWLAESAAIRDEIGGKGPLSVRRDELQTLILERARLADRTMDDESREKTLFLSADGKKLGQYSKSGFRVN